MAPKRKRTTSELGKLAGFIPPNDENKPFPNPYIVFRISSISKSDLLCLVEIGVILPIELSSLMTWEELGAPTEDTHETVFLCPSFVD